MRPPAPHIPPVLARAREAFTARFGREPTHAAAAPGRVNLIGEHTDYTGGFVLPMAIDRVCVAVGAMAADPAVSRVFAADVGRAGSFDARAPIRLKGADRRGPGIERGSWLSYVAGVVAGMQRLGDGAIPNLDIAITSSVPLGSGLSSSASLEVSAATLLESVTGRTVEPRAKALLCQHAEHEFAGVPCGIMDQFTSVLGREGHALLIDCRSLEATPVPMPGPDRAVILVMNTGVHHALASGEYAKRRAACAQAEARLGVSLRAATLARIQAEFREGDPLLPIAHHVVTENARTLAAAAALRAGDLASLGALMNASHDSLRDDYRVSCEELDTLVDTARAVPGVYGARMTGGGFGGCAIALAGPAAAAEIGRAIPATYLRQHGHEASLFTVVPADGAFRLEPCRLSPLGGA
jgi:galactokinase